MVKITHYEVYTGRNNNWKLEGRYPSDQRESALILAKSKEKSGTHAVKIIREDFDIKENSYTESIEYVSGLSNNNPTLRDARARKSSRLKKIQQIEKKKRTGFFNQDVFVALLTLVLIILVCLFFSNLVITLLFPVIEIAVPEDSVKTVMFTIFFILFLAMAVPLVLNKVPWYVFAGKSRRKFNFKTYDKKLISKAEAIIERYNLNDNYTQSIAPSYPEASMSHKRYIVNFLSKIVDGLGKGFSLKDSFSKLGVKLIIYGGCMELSRYDKLKINEANSLLFEAFKIIDGQPDIIGFYEAKKSYNDTREAIYLTGVGAYMMSLIIKRYPIDIEVLRASFEKWQNLNDNKKQNSGLKDRIKLDCLVNIQNVIRVIDDFDDNNYNEVVKVKSKFRKIVSNILEKLNPIDITDNDDFISVHFHSLNEALLLSIRFFEYFNAYQDGIEHDNFIIDNKCNIISHIKVDSPEASNLIEDIFDNAYDSEIIIDEKVKSVINEEEYTVDYLGEKSLQRTAKTMGLYKLIF